MKAQYNGVFVPLDIGGPIRDSSESMGTALKTALNQYVDMVFSGKGPKLNLDNRLMWQLYTIKGSATEIQEKGKLVDGGDYMSWLKAAYAIEMYAQEQKKHPDKVCMDVLTSKDPLGAVQGLVGNYPLEERIYKSVGKRAWWLFGNYDDIIEMSRLSDGAYDGVRMLYEEGVLMGIVSAAPSEQSAVGYPNMMIRDPLREEGCVGKEAEIFHPDLVHWGKELSKTGQLKKSVMDAIKIIGLPRYVFFAADINDDIIQSAAANEALKDEGVRAQIWPVMVKCGMGLPMMWEAAWKEAGLKPEQNYFEVWNMLEAAELIANYS